MPNNLLTAIFMFIGACMMFYSLFLSWRLKKMTGKHPIKKNSSLLFLVIIFLVGYFVYLFMVIRSNEGYSLQTMMISTIFLLCSLLSVRLLEVNIELIRNISDKNNLKKLNNSLYNSAKKIEEKSKELEITKEDLKKKNMELIDTLEDFYTLRLSMEKHNDNEKDKKDNEMLKARLDEVKAEKEMEN